MRTIKNQQYAGFGLRREKLPAFFISNEQTKKKPANRHKSGFRGPSPDVGKATQFQPGQSGNPDGRPKKRLLDELLEELLEADDSARARKIAIAVLKKASRGDVKAAQLTAERTQGKAKQSHEISGPGGGPIPIQVISKIPRPNREHNAVTQGS